MPDGQADLEFIAGAALRRTLEEARFGRLNADLLFLLKTLALEAWLRAKGRPARAAAALPALATV